MRRRKETTVPQPPTGGGKGLARVEFELLDSIQVAKRNPKGHNLAEISASIKRFGFVAPLLYNEGTGKLVAGHGRLAALKLMREHGDSQPAGLQGEWEVPVIRGLTFANDREAEAYLVADNRLVELGGWDADLKEMLKDISDNTELALEGVGYTDADLEMMLNGGQVPVPEQPTESNGSNINVQVNHGALSTRFLVPPFTVLDARAGWWADRKRLWLSLGIKSEEGRDGLKDTSLRSPLSYFNDGKLVAGDSGSIFDPVLCELVYSWFCPPDGKVFDPFAGGSVRGVVAAKLGRHYRGIELRGVQVDANRRQWADICAQSPALLLSKPSEDNLPELTPVQEHGGHFVKRDDLYCVAGVRGGKVRTCWNLAQGAKGLVTAGSRASPQVNIVAHIAARLGVPCRVHTPEGELSLEVQAAQLQGAEVVQHKPGHNSVIVARAREDAKAQGYREIPFGMECQEAIEQTRKQVANLPFGEFERIVVPVGSGMSLAGILHGLKDLGQKVPVLGVVVGAQPDKRLDKYAPKDWRDMVSLVDAGMDYHDSVARKLGQLELDAHYEAKVVDHLQDGDLVWVVGIRQTQADAVQSGIKMSGAQWKISAAWASKRMDCTLHGITRPGGCGGACCKSQAFWPPMSGENACPKLGPKGCTFEQADMPITCLLYPLRENKSGLLVVHHRAITGHCKSNYKQGPTIIESMRTELGVMFGSEETERIIGEILAGRDAIVDVPNHIVRSMKIESEWEQANLPPKARREALAETELPIVEPKWEQGDSAKVKRPKKPDTDLVFSCPPYADLEVYSDDPADISNMPYDQFLTAYREIIRRAVARLKPNRFAVWVVGEVRDAGGNYRNFVGDTVQAFRDAGADFYNEAIVVTPAGTLPLRAGRQFAVGRKLGKCHQNVLVFVKGDGKEAAKACGEVIVHVPGDQPE